MKKTPYTFFIVFILAFGIPLALKAQEKHEYMILSYNSSKEHMFISVNGKDFINESVDVSKKEGHDYNANPLIKKIKEYEEKGWELMNISTIHTYEEHASYIEHWANMRRKIK